MAVEVIFDAFNVMNDDNWWVSAGNQDYSFNNGSLNEDFGVADEPGSPRSYQVGAKFTF
jgi:hypothetical protein